MKCSICNTENPPDATSCQQCGFSFSLSQPSWPDFPTVEVPEPTAVPEWPELPETKASPASPKPVWPVDDALVPSIESIEIESVTDQVEIKEEIAVAEPPPSDQPSDDDQLARSHIARGFEAIRKGLDDQAKWEFEQARDLADDTEIVRMARAQLAGLHSTPVETTQERAHPRQVQPRQPPPTFPRKPTSSPIQISNVDWDTTVRFGLILGLLNGVLTGCGAVACFGFLVSPAAGFIAGWLAARKDSTADTVRKNDQSSNVIPAIIVGGITGLGGWLGEIIGHPIWVASTSTSSADPFATGLFVACVPGIPYILLAIVASVVGWRVGGRKA